jgi:cytochrome P450
METMVPSSISLEVWDADGFCIVDLLYISAVLFLVKLWFSTRGLKERHWPVVPGALPFIGNALGPGGSGNFSRRIIEWASEFGGNGSDTSKNPTGLLECNIFGTKYMIVCNNELATRIIHLRPYRMIKNQKVSAAARSVGADGIFSAEGTAWRHDRRIVAPALNLKSVRDYLPLVQEVTIRLIEKWKSDTKGNSNGECITINRDILCYGIDNIGLIAFGKDFDSLSQAGSADAKDVQLTFRKLFSRSLAPIKFWKIPFIGDYIDGAAAAKERLRSLIHGLIERETAQQEASSTGSILDEGSSTDNPTFLSKIVSLSRSEKNPMPLSRVHGNLHTMFIAGSDTTASAIMVSLWKIATDNTGLQEELATEAMTLPELESMNADLTMDHVMNGLPKLRSLFYEVVRAAGPAPGIMAQSTNDFTVQPGVVLPPGTRFVLPLQYLSKQPGSGVPIGPNKTPIADFCPRRWRVVDPDGNVTGVTKPAAKTGVSLSSGFGSGARICPGQHLAEIEVLVCLASILRAFSLSIPPDHEPFRMISRLAATPAVDIRLILEPR